MSIPNAARLHDPISHSSALGGLLVGAILGAVIAVAVVGTGGAALALIAAVAAGASMGAGIGELLGSLLESTAGAIKTGSPTVSTNRRPAARAGKDLVDCHDGERLAEGSKTVRIETHPASRKADKTTCDGKVKAGSPDTFIGGPPARVAKVGSEIPVWLQVAVFAVGLFGAGAGIRLAASGTRLTLAARMGGGMVGGLGGGFLGQHFGGEWFGEGSRGQRVLAFVGAMGGGMLGAGIVGKLLPRAPAVPPRVVKPVGSVYSQHEGVASTETLLYRGDRRSPEQIFANGFRQRDNHTPVSLETYVTEHPYGSQWISTTKSPTVAANSHFTGPEGHVYVVNKPGGADVGPTFLRSGPLKEGHGMAGKELEVAFSEAIKPTEVAGAFQVVSGKLGPWIPNPSYKGPPFTPPSLP